MCTGSRELDASSHADLSLCADCAVCCLVLSAGPFVSQVMTCFGPNIRLHGLNLNGQINYLSSTPGSVLTLTSLISGQFSRLVCDDPNTIVLSGTTLGGTLDGNSTNGMFNLTTGSIFSDLSITNTAHLSGTIGSGTTVLRVLGTATLRSAFATHMASGFKLSTSARSFVVVGLP